MCGGGRVGGGDDDDDDGGRAGEFNGPMGATNHMNYSISLPMDIPVKLSDVSEPPVFCMMS